MTKDTAQINTELDQYKTLNKKMTILILIGFCTIGIYLSISSMYPFIFFDDELSFFLRFMDIAIYFVVFLTAISIFMRIFSLHKIKFNNLLLGMNQSLNTHNVIIENKNQIKKIIKTIFVLIAMLVFEVGLYLMSVYFTLTYLGWILLGLLTLTSALVLVLMINLFLWKTQLNKFKKLLA